MALFKNTVEDKTYQLQKDNPEDLRGITWESIKDKMKNTVSEFVRQQL